ncbi:unnamed protein product [Microthlaspi erraticum]|uniref:Uncharacterized protein n=1 Tax=Microthlaspi erraticum TaxID=1685480 RepID=A0A6D2KSV0_9BRAS|nr:unnamed protein product [Microthlaspi erraticum]
MTGPSLKAPKVDLKPLPKGLRYAFLGSNSTYPVIVNDALTPHELETLLVELRKYRRALGYSLEDIKGLSPTLCTHRIHLENESKGSIEHQRRLNPILKKWVLERCEENRLGLNWEKCIYGERGDSPWPQDLRERH